MNLGSDEKLSDFGLSPSSRSIIAKPMHCMSYGLDALDGLSSILADSIESDIGTTGNQAIGLLKRIQGSLLNQPKRNH